MNHTPEPWTALYDPDEGYDSMTGAYKIMSGKRILATIDLYDYGQKSNSEEPPREYPEAHSNAVLMAEAPALLEALKKTTQSLYIAILVDYDNEPVPEDDPQMIIIKEARAAIARAEGR